MWLTVRGSSGETVATHRLDEGATVTVGRDRSCTVAIDDETIGPIHVRLTGLPGGRVGVEDLGSPAGTWIDGVRLSTPATVEAGRAVRVGRHTIGLSLSSPASGVASGPLPGFVVQPAAPSGRLLSAAGSAAPPARASREGPSAPVVPPSRPGLRPDAPSRALPRWVGAPPDTTRRPAPAPTAEVQTAVLVQTAELVPTAVRAGSTPRVRGARSRRPGRVPTAVRRPRISRPPAPPRPSRRPVRA